MTAYATINDISDRYPNDLIILAADSQTRELDEGRVVACLADAGAEIRAILQARYSAEELRRLDAEGLSILKVYSIDIALYRVALSFSRSTDQIKERYEAAIKRLEAIATGKGGLTFEGGSVDPDLATSGDISPNEVLIDVPPRPFGSRRSRTPR